MQVLECPDGEGVELRMRRLIYGVRWDPRRGVYVAYCHNLAGVSGEDEFSTAAAIAKLNEAARDALRRSHTDVA